MIWALVLAAGESRRMGEPKMILPFGEGTLLGTVVQTALTSAADGVAVVTGADRERVEACLSGFPVKFIHNPDYPLGMLSSVQRGWAGLPPETSRVMILLGDQPGIPYEVLDRLIEASQTCGKGIVLPVHKGRRGHPVLIDARYGDEVNGLDPAVGLRGLLILRPDDVAEIPVETDSILKDIDSKDDYRKAKSAFKAGPAE